MESGNANLGKSINEDFTYNINKPGRFNNIGKDIVFTIDGENNIAINGKIESGAIIIVKGSGVIYIEGEVAEDVIFKRKSPERFFNFVKKPHEKILQQDLGAFVPIGSLRKIVNNHPNEVLDKENNLHANSNSNVYEISDDTSLSRRSARILPNSISTGRHNIIFGREISPPVEEKINENLPRKSRCPSSCIIL